MHVRTALIDLRSMTVGRLGLSERTSISGPHAIKKRIGGAQNFVPGPKTDIVRVIFLRCKMARDPIS
jgi:hypothetical protein